MIEVLRWDELVRRAGSAAKARTWLRGGDFQRVLRDAYVYLEDPGAPLVRAAAVRRVLPPDVALSHRSALWVLGEDVLERGVLDVTVPRSRHLVARRGLRVHTAALPDAELIDLGGLLVVSLARSVVDVLRDESAVDHAVAFGDRALRLGATTMDLIECALDAASGLRGIRRARAGSRLCNGRSESWQESRLRVRLHFGGLPELDVQWDAYDEDGHVGRADLHIDGAWVEYDGLAERLKKQVFVAERRRQGAVADLGFEVRRFTDADVEQTPASLAAEVRRAVGHAAGRDRSRLCAGPDTLRAPRLSVLPTLAVRRRRAA